MLVVRAGVDGAHDVHPAYDLAECGEAAVVGRTAAGVIELAASRRAVRG